VAGRAASAYLFGVEPTPGGGEIVEAHFLDADGYPLDGPDGGWAPLLESGMRCV